jgi:plastocyanin
MLRKILFVLLAALSLVACREGDGLEAEPGIEVNEEDQGDEGASPSPLEDDDCAEVSAAEGAPAPVTMMDTFFEPPCFAISSTQTVALANAGNLEHNFSVAEGGIDVDVDPGEEAETDEIGTDLAAGSYRFFCEYHQGQGMVGTLVVE